MLDRLRQQARLVDSHTDDIGEHEAFVELLVAAVYADHRVTQTELDEIESFDATHPDWDEGAFTVGQHFGPAAAKVRRAHADGTLPLLVIDISSRLLHQETRRAAVTACAAMLRSDGLTDEERTFLDEVAAALS